MAYLLSYDIGTTGVKTCLFSVDEDLRLIAHRTQGYPLYILPDGGAEQDGDDWWCGMCETTRALFADVDVRPEQVEGISFCSQMQATILTDAEGVPVHRPMIYMDQRATEEIKKGIAYGPQIAGANIFKAIPSLIITGAITSSVKDPVWKYKWIEAHEPEAFSRAAHWLDVKDYLISRCTGKFIMTEDSAFSTLIYDTRPGKTGWSKTMCRMFDIREDLLPPIIRSTDRVGGLTEKAAAELGLAAGTPVFGGGGDSSLVGVGAGCVRTGDTHMYIGTSGWVITVTDHQMVDADTMIAAIVGAQSGKYNYFAEMETAGKCLEWAKNHLAQDEIGIYAEKTGVDEAFPEQYPSLYDALTEAAGNADPGSGGVIFTPWLHGNRCPFEDPNSMGMYFGVKLNTGKDELIRATLEGTFYHLRWMLECQDRKLKTAEVIRLVGGGALSPVSCQMLADITGRTIEVTRDPQNAGSVGAAAVAAVGLGLIPDLEQIRDFIPVVGTYVPDKERHAAYEPYYRVFKKLHSANRKLFAELNRAGA